MLFNSSDFDQAMETKEDLQKLTVVQLREKLKGRNLASTGAKNELIDRLYESFQEEENLLSGSGANDDLDVDDLLGTNLDEHSLTSKEEALLLGINPKATKTVEAPKAVPQKPIVPTEAPKSAPIEAPPEAEKPKPAPTEASKPKIPRVSAEGEAKLKRMQRFGLPLQASDDKGTGADKSTATNGASKPKMPRISSGAEGEAKLKRMQRFGLPLQASDDKGTEAEKSTEASAPKKPRISASSEDDAKLKRMQRFGAK